MNRSIFFPDDQYERIAKAAKLVGKSTSALVAEEALKRAEKILTEENIEVPCTMCGGKGRVRKTKRAA